MHIAILMQTHKILHVGIAQGGDGETLTYDGHTVVILENGGGEDVGDGLLHHMMKGTRAVGSQEQRNNLLALHYIAQTHGQHSLVFQRLLVGVHAHVVVVIALAVRTVATVVQHTGGQRL